MNLSLLKQPSALAPMVMSLAALSILLGYVALYGFAHQEDEGTAAHLFQLLMAAQVPIVAYFALKWLPRSPGPATVVLALQATAGLVPMVTLYIFEHASR